MSDNLPAVYDVQSLEVMAKQVANSRLFGLDPAQAFTLMLLAQSKGLHPIQAVERYHVINGKPAMKADAMLAEFQASGGVVEWLTNTVTAVEATFTHPKHAPKGVRVAFTMEDAHRAELTRNPTWKKFPANMLRARVISNGIRMVMPGILSGIYTPEEVADFVDERRPVQAEVRAQVQAPPVAVAAVDPPGTRPTRGRDNRPYHELAADGLEATNREFRDEYPGADDVVNAYQLDRHLARVAAEAGLLESPPRTAKAADLARQLALFYQTAEGRAWVRREMAEYLARKLGEAREKAALEAQGDGEVMDGLVEVEAGELVAAEREPGQEG